MLRVNQVAAPELRVATEKDTHDIRALLDQNSLPTSDIESSRPEFIIAREGAGLVAVGGVQRFGAVGLLRSVAVSNERRGAGLGHAVVQALEHHAHRAGVTELVLLTQTARQFFERLGYSVIERNAAPAAVLTSDEFRALCPQSATCMLKRFD